MRILMLGWEFPPFISGGLGTACYGLTKALSERKTDVVFVLPKSIDSEYTTHVKLLAPQAPQAAWGDRSGYAVASTYAISPSKSATPRSGSTSTAPTPDTPAIASQRFPVSDSPASTSGSSSTSTPTKPGTPLSHPAAQNTDELPEGAAPLDTPVTTEPGFENVIFKAVPSRMVSPYSSAGPDNPAISHFTPSPHSVLHAGPMVMPETPAQDHPSPDSPHGFVDAATAARNALTAAAVRAGNYTGDLLAESQRYADLCVDLAHDLTVKGEKDDRQNFDIIHAHDWLTFPAGLAVAAASGKPLIVHIHSTEYDRNPEAPNKSIIDIERRGMLGAIRVIAVSHLTRSVMIHNYGIPPEKIDVVYNAPPPGFSRQSDRNSSTPMSPKIKGGYSNSYTPPSKPKPEAPDKIAASDKVVLYLGRVTAQKGPEFFVKAAKKVLDLQDNVKFVIAGSGDMTAEIIELAAEEGIGHKVLFTGFLNAKDVERVFKMADVYVMPSVSEPFGIAPLEAISHDVPVIISKQSGVSEVLKHALKVDFWDTDDIADKIIAVIKHDSLSTTLRREADIEVKKLTWTDAADSCLTSYATAVEAIAE